MLKIMPAGLAGQPGTPLWLALPQPPTRFPSPHCSIYCTSPLFPPLPLPQGVMMGILTAAGSLARALGPMGFSVLYQHYGPYVTFGTVVGIMALTILFILVISPRLVAYERYVRKKKVFVQIPDGPD